MQCSSAARRCEEFMAILAVS